MASCSRDEFSVSNLQVQPYVRQGGQMGLSLYVMTDVESPESMQMVVRDPSGNLSWSFNVSKESFGGSNYYGTSDISMPLGASLPTGQWDVRFTYKDGSVDDISFEVSYSDVDGALARFEESGSGSAWFDTQSNLTVLP